MGKTEISWADETWNPVRGCSRVSEGCRHCYAETTAARFSGPGQPYEGLVKVVTKEKVLRRDFANGSVELRKHETREARWTGAVRFIASALSEPLRRKKPTRYFVNSMSDLFHDGFSNEQIAAVFGVMAACPQHTFMVLTKRPQRMREWFEWVAKTGAATATADPGNPWWSALTCIREAAALLGHVPGAGGATWPLLNVWIGVSVENQAAADERIPLLLQTPAAVRFLSCEPLLGPVRLHEWLGREHGLAQIGAPRGLSLAIVGCESGHGARPCEVEWLRSLRDQCTAAGVAFWLKQANGAACTEWRLAPDGQRSLPVLEAGPGSKRKQGGIIELPYLDGVQWRQLPPVKP
jgi:protein gp37